MESIDPFSHLMKEHEEEEKVDCGYCYCYCYYYLDLLESFEANLREKHLDRVENGRNKVIVVDWVQRVVEDL